MLAYIVLSWFSIAGICFLMFIMGLALNKTDIDDKYQNVVLPVVFLIALFLLKILVYVCVAAAIGYGLFLTFWSKTAKKTDTKDLI
jgi:hypothetical protein